MKAIVNTAAGEVRWLERAKPEPAAGQVRIRTAACGVCATDLEMIAGWDRTGFPSVPGHEWSGVVDAVGAGVDRGLIAHRCVAENVLADGGEVGFEHSGGYGQFLITEAKNVQLLPANFSMTVAALIEPLAVCVRALGRLRLESRRSAAIFGDGTIGLLMLALLRRQGVERIVLVGGRPARLEMARQLGADAVVDYHAAGDLREAVLRTAGHCQSVIEASGSSAAIAASLDVGAVGAKLLVIGDYGKARADFPWNHILHRELEIVGSNASAGAWPEAVRLATSGEIPLSKLVSRVLPASQYAEALDLAKRSRDVIKVVMDWTRIAD